MAGDAENAREDSGVRGSANRRAKTKKRRLLCAGPHIGTGAARAL